MRWRDTFGLDNYIAEPTATEHARHRTKALARKERVSDAWWPRRRGWTRRDFLINGSRDALGRKKQFSLTGDRTYFAIERVSLDRWQLTIRRGPFDYVQLTGTLGECNRARLPPGDVRHHRRRHRYRDGPEARSTKDRHSRKT